MLGLFDDALLFDAGKKDTRFFNLGDVKLILQEQFFEKAEADRLYNVLLKESPWRQRERQMYDKVVLDPRLTAWYDQSGATPWPAELLCIKNKVEASCGMAFDSVLLNLYRDGKDSVSWHSDTRPADGIHKPIGSVSFGQTRPFHIRYKYNKKLESFSIPLTHGSFLLMPAPMQENWEHHIPKTTRNIAPRINLTFRISA